MKIILLFFLAIPCGAETKVTNNETIGFIPSTATGSYPLSILGNAATATAAAALANNPAACSSGQYVNDIAADGTLTCGIPSSDPGYVLLSATQTFTAPNTFTNNTLLPGSGIWNTSGKVGIGTTNPPAKLSVSVPVSGVQIGLAIREDGYPTWGWDFRHEGTLTGDLYINHLSNTSYSSTTTFQLGGNVGIGTTNPVNKLDVSGAIGLSDFATFSANTGPKMFRQTANGFVIQASSWATTNNLSIASTEGNILLANPTGTSNTILNPATGNVGIGTTAPTSTLHISGGRITVDCPTGFTSVTGGNGLQLGCIQTAEGGSATWIAAMQECLANHGGRLPTTYEWVIATTNYTLTDETDDDEWMSEAALAEYAKAYQYGEALSHFFDDAMSETEAYRCWIPK